MKNIIKDSIYGIGLFGLIAIMNYIEMACMLKELACLITIGQSSGDESFFGLFYLTLAVPVGAYSVIVNLSDKVSNVVTACFIA